MADTEPDGSLSEREALQHHTGEGRNVVPADSGHAGHDIFFAAVQMSRMPMILTDPRGDDNPIIFCNHAFERLTGYDRGEILGRNCRFLQGAATDSATIARIREALARREDTQEEIFNYRKNGTGFWNALYVSPVFDPDGNLRYFFASQLDITRRREAEAVLQQAQRLETLGSMASGVAHEFNNLMTIVLGSLSQVDRGLPAESPDRERLDRANWAARQAGRLTQQMLSFARRRFHEQQLVDLNGLIGDVDGVLRQMAGDGVSLDLDLAPTPMMVELDVGQTEMALLNLIRNAADALPSGGPIRLSTREHAHEAGAEIECAVEDHGTGMSAAVVRRAIEPFFTTKEPGRGTGLGLSMVNGFVTKSGGRMEIASHEGEGTRISLFFPRSGARP